MIFSKLVENWDEINEMEVFFILRIKKRTDYNHLEQLNWFGTNEWKFCEIEMWASIATNAEDAIVGSDIWFEYLFIRFNEEKSD